MQKNLANILVLFLICHLSACSITGPDDPEIVFPEALALDLVELAALEETQAAPDSVNVLAYVVDRRICPKDFMCILPDGIIVSERNEGREGLFLPTVAPAFEEGERYLISVTFSDRVLSNSQIKRDFGVLGRSRARDR